MSFSPAARIGRTARYLILSILALASCRERSRPIERLAILPLENLGAQVELDWIGPAASAALAYDLEGSSHLHPMPIAAPQDAPGIRATRVAQGYFYAQAGRIELHVDVQDSETRKTVAALVIRGDADAGIPSLVNQIARRLDPAARSLAVSPAAFRDYGQALTATDPTTRASAYEAATQTDPNFGGAYISWSRWLASNGDRDAAVKAAQEGEAHHPDPIDLAQLQFLAASARSDVNGQTQALSALSRLTPADSESAIALAQVDFNRRKFADAVRMYQTALSLDPENSGIQNLLGYAQAFTGDLDGAKKTLSEYQKLLPAGDANGFDSLGEVSFYLGDFRSAEDYFLSADRKISASGDADEVLKAAQARLMTGDLAAADKLFAGYIGRRGGRAHIAGYQDAQWKFITGRRQEAIAELEKIGPALTGDASSLIYSQLAIWKLESGDSKTAEAAGQEAVSRALSPAMRNMAGLARYLSSAPAGNSGSPFAVALRFLLARDFAKAVPPLESLYQRTSPSSDGQVRALLAWALMESGRAADARPLLRIWPMPLTAGDPLFASLVFPRWLDLEARAAASAGQPDEAKRLSALYDKLK